MNVKYVCYHGQNYSRISKKEARKKYAEGYEILLVPCKARNAELFGCLVCKTDHLKYPVPVYFDQLVNEFEYYNLNSGLGNRTEFYIY